MRLEDEYEPKAGLYWTRLVSRGPKVPVEVWFGPPIDPEDGTLMDRAPRWHATAWGYPIDFKWVHPGYLKNPITEDEYEQLMEGSNERD